MRPQRRSVIALALQRHGLCEAMLNPLCFASRIQLQLATARASMACRWPASDVGDCRDGSALAANHTHDAMNLCGRGRAAGKKLGKIRGKLGSESNFPEAERPRSAKGHHDRYQPQPQPQPRRRPPGDRAGNAAPLASGWAAAERMNRRARPPGKRGRVEIVI